ncbi:MAG: hypothetical protein GX565_07935 [Lentisphaerae bacterium]|nr:hypothetical protein [Lentisphaerota bacterium]
MSDMFVNETALIAVIKARLKAAGELAWQRHPLPWTHPGFKSCPVAAARLLDACPGAGAALVMRDACLRHVRELVLIRGLTLAVPCRYGDSVYSIPASAVAGGRPLRLDPLPEGSVPYQGTVDLVVVACLAFSASERRLYTFECERTAFVLDELRQGLVNGWSLPADVPVVAVAADQQEVTAWPESAKGFVEADAVFTQTRTLILGSGAASEKSGVPAAN